MRQLFMGTKEIFSMRWLHGVLGHNFHESSLFPDGSVNYEAAAESPKLLEVTNWLIGLEFGQIICWVCGWCCILG